MGKPGRLLHQPSGIRLPVAGRERRVPPGPSAVLPAAVYDVGLPVEAQRGLRSGLGLRWERGGGLEGKRRRF